MPYCPSCESEYTAGTTTCADCNVDLVDALPQVDTTEEEMHDFYVCYADQAVMRVTALLGGEGIEALVRDRASTAFPTNVGIDSEKFVAVPQSALGKARELIQSAVTDGVLTAEDGQLM